MELFPELIKRFKETLWAQPTENVFAHLGFREPFRELFNRDIL